MDYSNWLTMSQVAQRLKHANGKAKSRAWAHKLRERGEFPSATQIAGVYLVDPDDVTAYLARQPKEQAAR